MVPENQDCCNDGDEQEPDQDNNEKVHNASLQGIYLGVTVQLTNVREEHVGSNSCNHHRVKPNTQNREKCLIESHPVPNPKSVLEENDDLGQVFSAANHGYEDLLEPNIVVT